MTHTKLAAPTRAAGNGNEKPRRKKQAPPVAAPAAALAVRQSKAALLRHLLAAPGGATAEALCQATGWQGHTVRAAVTAVRKSGVVVETTREGGVTVYGIAGGTPAG